MFHAFYVICNEFSVFVCALETISWPPESFECSQETLSGSDPCSPETAFLSVSPWRLLAQTICFSVIVWQRFNVGHML